MSNPIQHWWLFTNHTAPWATGETETLDLFTSPSASFAQGCKLRVRDAWRAKLAYCFLCFPKGHEDAGLLWFLLPASGMGAVLGPGMSCLESLYCSSGLYFLQDTSAVLVTRNIDQAEGKMIFFSVRGSSLGEVSLKVSRSDALWMLSPSLEIS